MDVTAVLSQLLGACPGGRVLWISLVLAPLRLASRCPFMGRGWVDMVWSEVEGLCSSRRSRLTTLGLLGCLPRGALGEFVKGKGCK